MKNSMEVRRFRTWVADTSVAAEKRWKIILRYGLLNTIRSWYVVVPLILIGVATIIAMFISTYEWTSPYDWEWGRAPGIAEFTAFLVGGALAAGLFVLLIGAGLFAEDLRFNAPLFYFSKPVRIKDYFIGKTSMLGLYLVMVVFIPVGIWLLGALLLGLPNISEPTFQYYGYTSEERALELWAWKVSHIDTFGDWIYTVAVVLPGLATALFFVASVTVLISILTRRAWHAAMGLVAVLGGFSLLGLVATDLDNTALQHIYGPLGWIYLAVFMPLQLRFEPYAVGYDGPPTRFGRYATTWEEFDNAVPAILIAYAFLLGIGLVCSWIAIQRLRRQEAWL